MMCSTLVTFWLNSFGSYFYERINDTVMLSEVIDLPQIYFTRGYTLHSVTF